MNTLLWDHHFSVLRLEGRGSRAFLQGQTSADIQSAETGQLLPACWLNATGRLQALLEIRLDASGADVLVLAGEVEAVQQGFDRVIFPADRVEIGKTRSQRRQEILIRGQPMSPVNVIWGDVVPSANNEPSTHVAASSDQLDQWRAEQGWPLGPTEMDGTTNPFELGLAPWVHLNKGCYLGQETVAKLASKGEVKQQLRSWRATTSDLSCSVLTQGTVLRCRGERAGVITCAYPVQSEDGERQQWIGLALVRRQALQESHLQLDDDQGVLALFQPLGFSPPPSRT